MEKEEVQKRIAGIIDKLLESYHDGLYGNDGDRMIRISHELITLYRVLDLFRE